MYWKAAVRHLKPYLKYPTRKLRVVEENWPCRACLGLIRYGEQYRGALSRRVHEDCLQRAIKVVRQGEQR